MTMWWWSVVAHLWWKQCTVLTAESLAALYMNKGEKQAFAAGLSIMNEQDRILTALVSQTPLNSRHMIVLKDCHSPWKTHDGVETLDIQEDWSKTRKKLIETVPKSHLG
jgi:hypothetical protein